MSRFTAAITLSDDLLRTRVHDDGADRADLNGDVRAGAGNHVEIRPDLNHFQIAVIPLLYASAQRDAGPEDSAGEEQRCRE